MPYAVRDVKRAAEARGILYYPKKGKGSHAKLKGPAGKAYILPSHNGLKTEVDDIYIRKLCACYEWDMDEFIADL